MTDSLPVPAQLEAQLDKCKTVRNAAVFYKARTKTAEVNKYCNSISDDDDVEMRMAVHLTLLHCFAQEIKAGRAKLPPKPTPSK